MPRTFCWFPNCPVKLQTLCDSMNKIQAPNKEPWKLTDLHPDKPIKFFFNDLYELGTVFPRLRPYLHEFWMEVE